jgi:glutathione S-transferase
MRMIELYQFPFSHFCEKARWALDYKGVRYRVRNLLPVFHVPTVRWRARQTSVPVLIDGAAVVQGSGPIAGYLETMHPEPPLTPPDPDEAREALDWEVFFDEEIGVQVRRWFYFHALRERRAGLGFLLQDARPYKRPLFKLAFPVVRRVMQRFMNIDAATARESEMRFRAAVDRLEEALEERQYLVGGHFSRADLTACALLSPFCLPDDEEAAARFPAAVLTVREELKDRHFVRWVRETYRTHRPAPVADTVA